ncbi:MAG: PhzF family phenazine biosynthesis protein [Actinomycetota bacterium]
MSIRIVQVDAFTDRPFAGNPAAVALVDERAGGLDDGFRQGLALEMNLSETAFPTRRSDGDWDLRWFTPAAEVDLCGHATLATAHVLFSEGLVDGPEIRFHTRSGVLICRRDGDAVVMDFPSNPPVPSGPVDGLAEALGVPVLEVATSFDVVAVVDSPDTVRALDPDLTALSGIDTRAVIATAAGDVDGGDAHYVCRVFAPRVGIAEDPVTGSAHTIVGPLWGERLGLTELSAHQCSARGGRLGVHLNGDRVELTGVAVTVLDGTLTLP